MYKIILPLLGFESVESADIIEQDEYFSTLVLNNEAQIKVHLVNINYINKFPLSFKIDETILEKLKVSKKEDFETY
jgi:flagellar assembly factor FliW